MIYFGGSGFESHRVQRFFYFSLWTHFLSKAIAQKVSFGIFIQYFNLPFLKSLYIKMSVMHVFYEIVYSGMLYLHSIAFSAKFLTNLP